MLSPYPDVVVCVYEPTKSDGRLLLDLLQAHPNTLVGGVVRTSSLFTRADPSARVKRRTASQRADRDHGLDLHEQVLAIAAHELRNPLAALTMRALALEQGPRLPAGTAHTLRGILAGARRMSRIVEDLFQVTSAPLGLAIELRPSPTDAHELCAHIAEELQLANPGREIRLRALGDGKGNWDRDRLAQVVTNLIGNALQYGPEGAAVAVETRGSEVDWTLSVQNLGEAIPAELQQHLFEPFRRARPGNGSGGVPHLGIGLFIVRRIVQAHGGSVEVTSGSPEGTRFVVRLPKAIAEPG
jgi:signal transduction histidine kinase